MIPNVQLWVNTMQNINWSTNTPICMLHIMFGPRGWTDLPDGLFYSIIVLMGWICDLIPFIATCPSWYATFMSVKSIFAMLFPSIIFRNCDNETCLVNSNNGNTWELIDPTCPNTPLSCSSRPCILGKMAVVKCFYGHAIFSPHISPLIMDMLIHTTIAAPHCPLIQLYSRTFIYPKASLDSYLLFNGPWCLVLWFGAPLLDAMWYYKLTFEPRYGGLQRLGYYVDSSEDIWRAFGTLVFSFRY